MKGWGVNSGKRKANEKDDAGPKKKLKKKALAPLSLHIKYANNTQHMYTCMQRSIFALERSLRFWSADCILVLDSGQATK